MVEQPAGTVTLVFTDIEGSTRLLHELGQDAYREALAGHREIVREACARHAGYEVDYEGDSFFFAFASALEAVSAVLEAMAGLEHGPVRIRVGVHTGEPGLDPPKYVGLDVNRAARIMAAAHGGQVLLSRTARDLVDGEVKDLGEHRLKDLSAPERLWQLGAGEFPPLRSLYRTNLPVPATPLVGRGSELREVTALIAEDDVRLVTLTGPGGTGKTRLALKVAADIADGYPDGVWWVPLASLHDPGLVLEAAAQALGARQELREHIADREMLLLFDNFEQVVGAAGNIAALLGGCPRLCLLVTSREPLRVDGEWEYLVDPLPEADAVELFCQRALAVRRDFAHSADVEEVVHRLDGLPLAIELAAARVRALSTSDLLARLDERLPLLTGGARDAPERQRTLRATIEWSYDLLTEGEQRLFGALSVFDGGWTLEAAETVCGADVATLQSLVDKSLVRFGGERYRMLQTVREFAAERLELREDVSAVKRAQAEHFLAFTENAQPHFTDTQQLEFFELVQTEVGNLRAALVWAQTEEPEWALRIAAELARFWMSSGYVEEGRHWLATVIQTPHPPSLPHIKAIHAAAGFAYAAGDWSEAEQLASRGVAMAEEVGDSRLKAWLLTVLGKLANDRGESAQAKVFSDEALAIGRATDDRWVMASALGNLAQFALHDRDYKRALALSLETADIGRDLGDIRWTIVGLMHAGWASSRQGKAEEATRFLLETLALARKADDRPLLADAVLVIALCWASEKPASALCLLAGHTTARSTLGIALERTDQPAVDQVLFDIRARLEPSAWNKAWSEGAAMNLEEAAAAAESLLKNGSYESC